MRTSDQIRLFFVVTALFFAGCASFDKAVGLNPLDVPPEFKQSTVIVQISDEYTMHQAPRSGYDVGDLQNFQSQHTFPTVAEASFKELFGNVIVQPAKAEAGLETKVPDVPAIFEVRIIDLANDISSGADNYRAESMIAVAMKSPRGNVIWQQAFRGDGYATVDPQFSTGLGPQDAVIDAIRDGLDKMQQGIIASPDVRNQLKHYIEIDQARKKAEVKS